MKVSLNWVSIFLDFDLPPVDELVAKIGAQLGGVDEVINLAERYQGIIIAKVVNCQPIEGSDHLSLCRIDDGKVVKDVERGSDGLVQVVCGAPNVREGLMVAWLPPGSTVPASIEAGEPFVLEAREIRGQKSNGMLASAKELALGDNHEGLLELDAGIKPGDDFAVAYGLNDVIIDIENKMFTHRPDLFGQLGVAREIAGIFGKSFKSPEIYLAPKPTTDNSMKMVEIRNELPELVPRLMVKVFENVTVGPSPVWLQAKLSRIGLRPINNVVDITNYFMMLTGQPFHAYDLDKLKAVDGGDKATLVVRPPRPEEKITLLNGKEIKPAPDTIMIASDKKPIGIGGVMGGAETEVDESTKNILLECATFDMYAIRRASMSAGVFSDAVTRFSKGQSPLQNDRVMAMITEELVSITGAVPGETADLNELPETTRQRGSLWPPVVVSTTFINERLGSDLKAEDMRQLLANVEFKVDLTGDELTVTAPFWRTDIERREDIVEEVGRLYGYDKVPLVLPKRDLTPAPKDPLLETKANIRARLAKAGANEVLTYSFVHGQLLDKTGQDKAKAFQIGNALSPELQYYRLSLMPSLLDKVHLNIKASYDEFALFELGKTHSLEHPADDDGLPGEFEFTALVVAAADKLKKPGAAYYQARKYLTNLTGVELDFKPVGKDMQQYPVVQPYDLNRAALVSIKQTGEFVGIVGEFKPSVGRQLKLPKYCAGFEVDTTALQSAFKAANNYVALPRFPKVTQDITLKVPAELPYQELFDFVGQELGKTQPAHSLPSLSPIGIYQREDDTAHQQITLRLTIANYDRTMTDTEVNALLDAVAEAAKQKFGAQRI